MKKQKTCVKLERQSIMMFTDSQVNLKEKLSYHFGFNNFKGNQEQIIQSILDGHDTFVIMPTGGGKSLCYQLPALIQDGTAIVVSPLIALMKNQVDAIRQFSKSDDVAHFLNSSLTKGEIKRVKQDVLNGLTKLLYVAPESLTKKDNIDFLKAANVSFFAIDEAHCISEWGHDFRPEYRKLKNMMEAISNVPVMALTATATPKVQEDIRKTLGMTNARIYKSSFNRDNLFYEVRPKVDVEKQIVQFVKQHEGRSGIVYCLSRKMVEKFAEILQVNGVKALPYHAGLEAKVRAKHQDMFLMEKVDVIVATIAFGMGIDKPDVRFVIHHDIPKSLEGYYQETGRAGRDGGEGHCIVFYNYRDIEKLEKFLYCKPVSEQEIGKQLLDEIVSFAETSVCRRKYILHYFGEEYDQSACDNKCDNCKDPKETYEAKELLLTLFSSINGMSEKQKAPHVAKVLAGITSSEIINYKHHLLPFYGIGKDEGVKKWDSIIRQAHVHGFLKKEIESYGVIKLTEKARDFLKSPYEFKLFKERDYSNIDYTQIATGKTAALDENLFKILKELRKKVAMDKEVPPFVVFQEPSLQEMCLHYPITLDELKNISGVGVGKANRFGKPFVNVIAKYVEENQIDRPQDVIVKSLVNKSGIKIHIITNTDKKIDLEDIAQAKNLSIDQLITEMETIVSSGTRINIGYYIDDMLDEESQEEVFDYFMEANTDCVDVAYEEFDGDYDLEELRLMRIKFMSEVAN